MDLLKYYRAVVKVKPPVPSLSVLMTCHNDDFYRIPKIDTLLLAVISYAAFKNHVVILKRALREYRQTTDLMIPPERWLFETRRADISDKSRRLLQSFRE